METDWHTPATDDTLTVCPHCDGTGRVLVGMDGIGYSEGRCGLCGGDGALVVLAGETLEEAELRLTMPTGRGADLLTPAQLARNREIMDAMRRRRP